MYLNNYYNYSETPCNVTRIVTSTLDLNGGLRNNPGHCEDEMHGVDKTFGKHLPANARGPARAVRKLDMKNPSGILHISPPCFQIVGNKGFLYGPKILKFRTYGAGEAIILSLWRHNHVI